MHKFIRQLFSGVVVAAAAVLPQAHAQQTTIDFDDASLANLYFPGDSFSQNGFTMSQNFDFGTVGTTADFGAGAPSGNATQFYFNSNDGDLLLTRSDGGVFNLDGFSAAFVPLLPAPVPNQTIVIVAVGIPFDGSPAFGTFFGLGAGVNNSFPFLSFGGAEDFGRFNNLVAVDFFACVLTASSVCDTPSHDNAQFALDNVVVTSVPEPTTTVLMALGLIGLAVLRRRSVR